MRSVEWFQWMAVALCMAVTTTLPARPTTENASNDPSTPSLGLNLQNQYTDSFFGLDDADSRRRDGERVPHLQIHAGLDLQLPLGRR